MKSKTFEIVYTSNTDFLKWTTVVAAEDVDDAVKKVYPKGKIVSVKEIKSEE